MKPIDLKYPFKWDERRPEISKRVLFVPSFYEKHHEWKLPAWEDPTLFGKKGKVLVEYCSGNGSWIVQKAKSSPNDHWIAIEKNFDRVRKIWSKQQNLSLNNLFIVCGEALTFTRYYLPENSVDEIYINFPDPWPKLKHSKHRLIQRPFVQELYRVLKQEGKAVFVTDHENYSKQMIEEMLLSGWKSSFDPPYFKTNWENYGTSYFDDLWRKKGKTIHYHQFVYQNGLKNREFDKEIPQNFDLERATIAHEQGASEDHHFEGKSMSSKTDSSVFVGIKEIVVC